MVDSIKQRLTETFKPTSDSSTHPLYNLLEAQALKNAKIQIKQFIF
jgi:hypothetical protein